MPRDRTTPEKASDHQESDRDRRAEDTSGDAASRVASSAAGREVGVFGLWALIATVPFWVLGATFGMVPGPVRLPWTALVAGVPALVALVMAARSGSTGALASELRRGAPWGWWVAAVLAGAGPTLVCALRNGPWDPPGIGSVLALTAVFVVGALGEELGWTGFALPRLVRWTGSSWRAGLLLAGYWAVWHLVPFIQTGQPAAWIVFQTLEVFVARLVMVALWERSGAGVGLAIAGHTAGNLAWACGPDAGGLYDPRIAVLVLIPLAVGLWWGRRRWGVTAVLALVSAVIVAILPGPFLPTPSGPYAVGTTTFEVVDQDRREIFAPGDRPRTIPAQVWYPARVGSVGPREPYVRDDHVFDGLLDWVRIPHPVGRLISGLPTHAVVDAPVADGRFPVVFVLTGNLGYRQSQTFQVEALVARGFVVVGLDQPGTVGSALLADGTRIPYAGPRVVRPLVDQSIEPAASAPLLNGVPYPQGILRYLAADPAAVLTALQRGEGPRVLDGHVDLSGVGAFGLSLGGATTSQWCATDPRVRACMMLDAPMTLDAQTRGLGVPALWLTRPAADMAAEGWPDVELRHFDGTQRAVSRSTRAPAWYVTVDGHKHADFSDAPYGSPGLWILGATSSNAGASFQRSVSGLTVDFFEHTLSGAAPRGVLVGSVDPGWRVEQHP